MSSPRERAESAASRAAADDVVPNQNRRADGMSHSVVVNRSVRGAQEKATYEKQEVAPVAENPWTTEYEREKARLKAQHDADVASGKIRYV
jgi:hypothetical protein